MKHLYYTTKAFDIISLATGHNIMISDRLNMQTKLVLHYFIVIIEIYTGHTEDKEPIQTYFMFRIDVRSEVNSN